MVVTAPRRAVIYRRISQDSTGEAAGVGRQREDCIRYCAQRGWAVVADIEDNDISASQYARKKRPGYAETLRLVEAGEADSVVAWHLDRLWRRPSELEHLIELVEKKDITVATLNGDIDLNNGDGRFLARILVSVAAKSSDDSATRLQRKMLERAEHGDPHGPRPFGWKAGGIELDPAEAAIARDMVERMLNGGSIHSVATALNARGIVTPRGGKEWQGTTVKRYLMNPRLAGLRVHQGQVIGNARWEPLIDEATHERLKAVIDSRSYKAMNPTRRRLLTRLIRCGRCDSMLTYGNPDALRCVKKPGYTNCGGLTVTRQPVEDIVVEAVLLRLDTTALAEALAARGTDVEDDTATAEIVALEGREAELAAMWAAGELDRREWSAARQTIEGRLEDLRRRASRRTHNQALAPYLTKPGALRAAWPNLELDQQRLILSTVIDRVVIAPATRRGRMFDPERVDVVWRV
ncbi:MAG: recombinase family protein [Acidimicrobiales bacterium]